MANSAICLCVIIIPQATVYCFHYLKRGIGFISGGSPLLPLTTQPPPMHGNAVNPISACSTGALQEVKRCTAGTVGHTSYTAGTQVMGLYR